MKRKNALKSIQFLNNFKKFILFISFCVNIIISFLTKDIIEKSNKLDLNNYLNHIYGEEDLLKMIKEKEKEMTHSYTKRNKLEKEIENMYNVIKKLRKIKEEKIKIMKNTRNITRDDGKLILSCSYALNKGFLYATLVSMTSLVINAGNNTFYNIYVLVSPDLTEEDKKILMSVEKNYTDHCKVIIINMGDKFKGKDTNDRIPIASYYRLELHNLLPYVDRVVYMDGDTAVFQDLSELITFDMKGNYILGLLDANVHTLEQYNIKNGIYICAGVLLMDLYSLRKNNISEKFNAFIEKNIGKLWQHDQLVINVVCHGKISSLPPKYGIWNFVNSKEAKCHNNAQFSFTKYNEKEYMFSYYNPAILHYTKGKPFHKHRNRFYFYEWWEYAKKTGYYDKIYNNYNKIF